jgi:hypothetical protein
VTEGEVALIPPLVLCGRGRPEVWDVGCMVRRMREEGRLSSLASCTLKTKAPKMAKVGHKVRCVVFYICYILHVWWLDPPLVEF